MTSIYQDVTRLTSGDLKTISKLLAAIPTSLTTMEEVADAIIDIIFNTLRDSGSGDHQCALVRLFKTCNFENLTNLLQKQVPLGVDESLRSLVLLASRGEHPSWNSRRNSQNHQLIPLMSREHVEQIPMISNLIRMLGLDLNSVISPNHDLNIAGFYPLSVFYVEEAKESPYIPAKDDFVIPYDIHSVVGFGGLLNFTDMFTIVLFFKVPVEQEIAALFKDLAEEVHRLLLPYQETGRIFKIEE